MKKLCNTEAELKKNVLIKKNCLNSTMKLQDQCAEPTYSQLTVKNTRMTSIYTP